MTTIDHVHTAVTNLPNGFIVGAISDFDFCNWILNSSPAIQRATVEDVTWWRSNKGPFYHQFNVLTIKYTPLPDDMTPNLATVQYNIRLERSGKRIRPYGTAEHRVVISEATPLSLIHKEGNSIMFGLMRDGREIGPGARVAAFRDILDRKWRGPRATLWHLAHYVRAIVELLPRYRLSSSNCYFFSRLLVHVISLRHYSFPFLVAGTENQLNIRSAVHDPSSISILFRYLHDEEQQNGILVYRNIIRVLWSINLIVFSAGCIASLVEAGFHLWGPVLSGLAIIGILLVFLEIRLFGFLMKNLLQCPFIRSLQAKRRILVQKLG